jgi:hypothetical protein
MISRSSYCDFPNGADALAPAAGWFQVRSDFWCFHRDVLRFVLAFWLRPVGIFRSLPSGKLVSQTSRLGIRPALPQTTPLHSTSNAGSVPERWLARVLLVRAVRCVGLARQFIVIWFDHTQPSPSLPMASTGHPSMASLQSASSSGVVGCLNT